MMSSQPSSPAVGGTRQRGSSGQQLYYYQQQQRLGGDNIPYRDDPTAEAPVPIDSWGPSTIGDNNNIDDQKRGNRRPLIVQCLNCIRNCCGVGGVGGSTTTASALSNREEENDDNENYYYIDEFNDMSMSCCTMGTDDDDSIWMNRYDFAGTIMSIMVWILLGYSCLTITLLAQTGGISYVASILYGILVTLALSTHAKTSLTDPGSVPTSAVPTQQQRLSSSKLSMCSQCQTYKPPKSHHCRICNRCISRMDHHCPWMNNCVGAGNLKHFLLFLIYTWTCSVFALILMGTNYFFCDHEGCTFNLVLTQLVRIMTVLCVGAFLFTSSMLMNVVYGIMTGIGTIDRLKKKANNTLIDSDEECIPLSHIFGIGPVHTWWLPIDPIFPDYDVVMGYSTPQRLLREQMMKSSTKGHSMMDNNDYASVVSRDSYYTSSSYVGPPPPPI